MEMRALVRNDVFSGDYALVRIPLQTGGMAAASLPKKGFPPKRKRVTNGANRTNCLGRASTNHTYTVIEFVGVGGDAVSIFVDEGPVHR